MKYFCFIGAPGAGKSTQIKRLQAYLAKQGEDVFTAKVTNLIYKEPGALDLLTKAEIQKLEEITPEALETKGLGDLANIEFDKILYKMVQRLPEKTIVLFDGSPRSEERAKLFCAIPPLKENSLVFHLGFPPEFEFEHSLSRQLFRGLTIRKTVEKVHTELTKYNRKYQNYENGTKVGLELLRENGVPIVFLDALTNQDAIHNKIVKELYASLKGSGINA